MFATYNVTRIPEPTGHLDIAFVEPEDTFEGCAFSVRTLINENVEGAQRILSKLAGYCLLRFKHSLPMSVTVLETLNLSDWTTGSVQP